jgi:ABC-type amino acid transport substrate-binding protein
MTQNRPIQTLVSTLCATILIALSFPGRTGDLDEVKTAGVLRHIGVPYANFITGLGDGFDVELMQDFATSLGVKYEYVQADWSNLFPDLIGRSFVNRGGEIEDQGPSPVKADVGANGITVLGWRQKVVDFSAPTFPTQVWLIARKDSPLSPIKPTGDLEKDIVEVRKMTKDRTLFCKAGTCLAPELFQLDKLGTKAIPFPGSLNDLAPAIIMGEADLTLLDVPDTLVALKKWPGQIKILGPVGPVQDMAVAFPKSSPRLKEAFGKFLKEYQASGKYKLLIEKYYPYAVVFFPDFFTDKGIPNTLDQVSKP